MYLHVYDYAVYALTQRFIGKMKHMADLVKACMCGDVHLCNFLFMRLWKRTHIEAPLRSFIACIYIYTDNISICLHSQVHQYIDTTYLYSYHLHMALISTIY